MSDEEQTRDEIEKHVINDEPVESVQEEIQEEVKPVVKAKAKAKANANVKIIKEPVAPSLPIKEEVIEVAEEKQK